MSTQRLLHHRGWNHVYSHHVLVFTYYFDSRLFLFLFLPVRLRGKKSQSPFPSRKQKKRILVSRLIPDTVEDILTVFF